MAGGPWEKFAAPQAGTAQPAQSGPWSRFAPQAAPEAAPQSAPERELVATTDDGGQIFRLSGGSLAYTSPGYSTSDPDKIAELMQGATPVDIVQSDFDRQRIDANPGRALLNEAVRGVPFVGSYTDEIIGATNPQAGENLRALSGAMQREEPGKAMAANVTGAIAGSIPLAFAAGPAIAASAPRTIGGQALAGLGLGAVAGGVEGAVYGAGQGEGEGPMGSRTSNALTQSAIGAGMGAVTGAAAPYAAAGVRNLMQSFRRSDVATISRELGVSRDAAVVIRNAIQSGDEDAARAALDRAGANAMLGDATQGTRSLLDTAAQMPGEAGATARGAVNERVTAATRQMNAALDDALGPVPEGTRGLLDDIMQQSSAPRQQAYETAFSKPINYASDQGRAIEGVLRRVDPTVLRQAVTEANAQMRDLGINNQQIRATISDAGEVVFDTMPDVRQLDALKQALDAVAENSKTPQGRLSPQGVRAAGQARALRNAISDAVPEYSEALRLGGQAIAERNAVDLGQNMLTGRVTTEEVMRGLRGATDAEKAAARAGVRSYIDETTSRITRTITDNEVEAREGIRILRDMSSRANQTRLRALLGNREADRLLSQIDEAATGFELRAAITENSKTAARQANQAAVEGQTRGGVLRTIGRGDPIDATKRVVQALTGETDEAQVIRDMGLYQEISEALVNTRGGNARNALRLIERAAQGQALTERQAASIARVVVGSLAGSSPAAGREVANSLSTR